MGIQGDWETQEIYTQLNLHNYFKKKPELFLTGRFGIAPYVGAYDDLHTWFIIQLDQKWSKTNSMTMVMPIVRMFKDNYLVEFGSDFKKKYLIAAMLHF